MDEKWNDDLEDFSPDVSEYEPDSSISSDDEDYVSIAFHNFNLNNCWIL